MSIPLTSHVDPFVNQPKGSVLLDYAERHEIPFGEFVALKYQIPVDAGKTVLEVRTWVKTAFAGATKVDIGDGTDADGYLIQGQLDPAVAGSFHRSFRYASEDVGGVATPNAYAGGKYYSATGRIIVLLDITPTAGELIVEVVYAGYGNGFPRGVINNTELS
jgi:hypothetical protein